jgi:hypothetical protein
MFMLYNRQEVGSELILSSYLRNESRTMHVGELKGLSHQFKRAKSGMVEQAYTNKKENMISGGL